MQVKYTQKRERVEKVDVFGWNKSRSWCWKTTQVMEKYIVFWLEIYLKYFNSMMMFQMVNEAFMK